MTTAVGETTEAPGWFTIAVADELRAHMARRRVSGRELARRLHVSHTWMSQRTKGAVALSTADIERICAILGITPGELLSGAVNAPATGSSNRRYDSDNGVVVRMFPQARGHDEVATRGPLRRTGDVRPIAS